MTATTTPRSGRQVLAVSHSGTTSFGATTAVALALEAARSDLTVLLVDLSPDGEATRWLQAAPWEKGQDVGAILDDRYPLGWARSLSVPTRDHAGLKLLPASSGPSREPRAGAGPQLRHALTTADEFDVVVIDCGRIRSGARFVAALNAATDVIVTTSGSPGDVAEVGDILTSVDRYQTLVGDDAGPDLVRLRGVVVGAPVRGSGPDASTVADLAAATGWSELALSPVVPALPTEDGTPSSRQRPFGIWKADSELARHYSRLAAQLIDAHPQAE
ncbi:ParA family protein [Georgenia sp. Z1491]|uniref:ParA family protein n=1 Tax=Georgenia sp. Z1491 TaxID=3416707 RepID=UPI003CF89F46